MLQNVTNFVNLCKISRSDKSCLNMLQNVAKFCISGVISQRKLQNKVAEPYRVTKEKISPVVTANGKGQT